MYENIPHWLEMMSVVASVYIDGISQLSLFDFLQTFQLMNILALYRSISEAPTLKVYYRNVMMTQHQKKIG